MLISPRLVTFSTLQFRSVPLRYVVLYQLLHLTLLLEVKIQVYLNCSTVCSIKCLLHFFNWYSYIFCDLISRFTDHELCQYQAPVPRDEWCEVVTIWLFTLYSIIRFISFGACTLYFTFSTKLQKCFLLSFPLHITTPLSLSKKLTFYEIL